MKKVFKKGVFILSIILVFFISSKAQGTTDSIRVNGDIDKYYIVAFVDGGWNFNVATEMEIGRSNTHKDGTYSGAMIGKFRFHVGNFGHGASFIDGDVRGQNSAIPAKGLFVAGWRDITGDNGSGRIIIWLRGNTTYYYRSNFAVFPVVYDGTQPLSAPSTSYKPGNITYVLKTAVDAGLSNYGYTYTSSLSSTGPGTNYFYGSVAIGTTNPSAFKLAVEGTIGARRVKVDQETWADFVFEPEYKLPSLTELETYIKTNKHLPDVPSAAEVAKEKLDLGEMNKILLQKIEELTLHLIEMKKENAAQQAQINQLINK